MQGHGRLSSMMPNMRKSVDRDSGFSDGSSGYFSAVDQTHSEDMGRAASVGADLQMCPQVAVMPSSYPGLSPMFIMNNIVLKQPNTMAPALKPWEFPPTLEMVPQSSLVLLQPVVPSGCSAPKSSADKQRRAKKFAPILRSFPKIAPHPTQGDQAPCAAEGSSPNPGHLRPHRRHSREVTPCQCSPAKRRMSEDAGELTLAEPGLLSWGNLHDNGPALTPDIFGTKPAEPLSRSLPHPATVALSLGARPSPPPPTPPRTPGDHPGISSPSVTMGDEAENFPEALSQSSSKHKRFCNTYNILSRSGLLGITLRTKELIRQNRRAQAQLQQLQAHTQLFLQATHGADPHAWSKLQRALQRPGLRTDGPGPEAMESVGADIAGIHRLM